MSENIKSSSLLDFLSDYETKSITTVYEDGKEKDEIIQIAKMKMGIDLNDNRDLAGFKTVYTFSDIANGNGARLPKDLLLKKLPTLIGKPVNIDHIRNYVVGYYIDYKYIEKEDQVIAYGIFFKSNFGSEWTEAKELLKAGKLGTSHEVWCPERDRHKLPDGTYEAKSLEFAGGALIYTSHEDWSNPRRNMQTAYNNCNVLEFAMKHMDQNSGDLIMASLKFKKQRKSYKVEDLIVANDAEAFRQRNVEEISEKVATINPVIPKVKCQNCEHEFETNDVGELSCSECKAVINREGKVLFPPQLINFNFTCPISKTTNWRLIEQKEEYATVKNLDSNKIYKLNFKIEKNNEIMDKLNFIYMGEASCPQCNKYISFSTTSKAKNQELNCKRCGLHFATDITKINSKKQIATYEDITDKAPVPKPKEKEEIKEVDKELESGNEPIVEGSTKTMVEETKELCVASITKESTVDEKELTIASLQDELDLEIASLKVGEDISNSNYSLNQGKLDRYKKVTQKLRRKIGDLRKSRDLDTASLNSESDLQIAKIQKNAEEKIAFYKANASELHRRRTVLGEFGQDLSDNKIIEDESYEKIRLEKENALLRAKLNVTDETVGDKSIGRDSAELVRLQKEINDAAFPKK